MDGLSIITGIGVTVFLLFYLAFSIDKEHIFLKFLTLIMGLFTLLFIPALTVKLNNECAISSGTYMCFYPNATQINLTAAPMTLGAGFHKAYLWYLIVFISYITVYYGWRVLKWLNASARFRK